MEHSNCLRTSPWKQIAALDALRLSQTDLARVLGQSRRIIGTYMAELEGEGICTLSSGRNQYARNIFEILDDYRPYNRPTIADETKRREEDA